MGLRVLDEGVGDAADVHQSVLVNADVYKRSESGDVGHDPRKHLPNPKVLDLVNIGVEGEDLEGGAGVAPGFLELLEDIPEGGQPCRVRDEALGLDAGPVLRGGHEVPDRAGEGLSHPVDGLIVLGVDGAGVERVLTAEDSQEADGLLVGLWAQTRDLPHGLAAGEGAIGLAVLDDLRDDLPVQPGDVGEDLGAGRVDVYPDGVDAVDHHVVQSLFELLLVHVVLVLSHTDGLRVYFDQLGHGVHQTAPDGHGAAHRDVVIGELAPRDLGGGVDGCAALVDGGDDDLGRKAEPAHEGLRFPSRRSVADGDRLDGITFHQSAQRLGRGLALPLGRMEVDHGVVQQVALGVQADDLAAGPYAGVDGERRPLPHGGGHEHLADVAGEDPDCLGVRPFLQGPPQLVLHGAPQEAPVTVLGGVGHEAGCGSRPVDETALEDGEGLLLRGNGAQGQKTLPLPAEDRQHAVRGHRGSGLPPVEVVPIVRPLLLLALDAGAGEDGFAGEKTARLLTRLGVLAEPFGQDVHGPGQRLLGGGDPFDLVDEGPCRRRGVERLGLGQEQVRQGPQPLFGGDGGPRPALGTPGQVDVLQGCHGTGPQDGVSELVGKELPFGQGLEDGGPALFQFGHPLTPVSYRGDDGLVQ